MNNLSHMIRKFNRFELKYIITLKQAERIKSALRSYLAPDDHGNNCGTYALASLYYDSPGLRCYHEKVDGVKFRRKLRIRLYETGEMLTDETPVFLEIKQRIDRVTQKRRVILPYGDALRLCNDRQVPDYEPEDETTIEEIVAFLWQYNLRPVSLVHYTRQAFISTEFDIGLRITFDTSLTAQINHLHLHDTPTTIPLLGANWVVMEIKINERIPYWLTELIAAHNLQVNRFSKYCRSIDVTQNIASMRWRNQSSEWSQDVISSVHSIYHPIGCKTGIRK